VSGGAYGIDAAAHGGALAAAGITIAVLACGPDVAYPRAHHGLLNAVAASGAVISEWPPGAPPARHRFLRRNQVIAALSQGTVVVEASARSGSLATARRAAELRRPLMAVPGPVTSAASDGCHALLREGRAACVTGAADILAYLAGGPAR
jgi:DNA processing protein